VSTGCGRFPAGDTASCGLDAKCQVSADGDCVARLCGHTAQLNCLSDDRCQWTSNGTCAPAECIAVTDATTCQANTNCVYTATMVPPCALNVCNFANADECVAVDTCVWDQTTRRCGRNTCPSLSQTECSGNTLCNWNPMTNVCGKAACSATTESACRTDPTGCRWVNTTIPGTNEFFAGCQTLSLSAMAARAAAGDETTNPTCTPQVNNMLPLAIFLVVFAVLLLGGLIWMCKRQAGQKAKQMDFSQKLMEPDELDDLMDHGGRDIDSGKKGLATTRDL